MEARHKFGTLTLGLAVVALIFSAFSIGSVWATADDRHVTEYRDDEGDLEYAIISELQADIELQQMESVFTITITKTISFLFNSETFAYTKTNEEFINHQRRCQNDVRRHGPGRLGRFPMIWMGSSAWLSPLPCPLVTGQLTNSRLTTLSGTVASITMLVHRVVCAPPSSGTYAWTIPCLFLFASEEYTVRLNRPRRMV